MRILIHPMAFYKIIEHSSKDLSKEIAGYLIGKIKRGTIQITDTATTQQKGTSTHVKMIDLEIIKVTEQLEKRMTNEIIIGWYHSHPKMGAHFFSYTDINTQKRYQKFLPKAIGLVFDPHKFTLSSKFEDIDCHIYHIKEEKLQSIKIPVKLKLKNGLKRIYRHLKILTQSNSSFVNDFENFIENELDGKIIPNYYGTNYRINYQQTPKKIWSHIFTKSYSRFQRNDLIIKGYFKGKCKKIEKKFQNIGYKANVTKDPYTNYYFAVLNIEEANFSQELSELLKELFVNYFYPQ
ncbi:MAG: Mov34/MPN/PAD-1 family protein [Candidatus Helarchaeota archaeon]|nr:Mov34/MPN/PAD-1 family protein [Candidatus Helarchaeota archaeon]